MTTTEKRTWWRQPGEVCDCKGIPIYPGDLIRTLHFIGARRKKHYLYHTAVFVNGYMEMVPTCHLQPEQIAGGGRCMLFIADMANSEVIAGHGPEPYLDFYERPRAIKSEGGKPRVTGLTSPSSSSSPSA